VDTQVGEAYSRRAAEYTNLFGSMDAVHPSDRLLVSTWAHEVEGPLIDAGCGPGQWTHFLTGLGREARGVDQVPEFIGRARREYPGLPFEVGDVDELDCESGTVGGADATLEAGGSVGPAGVGSAGDADPLQAASAAIDTTKSARTTSELGWIRRMTSVLSWMNDRDAARCRTVCRAGRGARLEQGDRLGDPVGRKLDPLVELPDEGLVGGGDEREHDLVGRHQDRADMLDPAPRGGHRPRRRLEPGQDVTQLGEVDPRPVPLDEERPQGLVHGRSR